MPAWLQALHIIKVTDCFEQTHFRMQSLPAIFASVNIFREKTSEKGMAISGADIRELTDNGLAEAAGLISRREYNLSIVRTRQTAELLIKSYAAENGLSYTTLADTIESLYEQGIINRNSRDAFHNMRIYGNKAVHEADNNPENAQKAYYLLKSEVSTFLSRKTVSVDRTPVRVDTASGNARQLGELEVEIANDPDNTEGRRMLNSSARRQSTAARQGDKAEVYGDDARAQRYGDGYSDNYRGERSTVNRENVGGEALLDNARRRLRESNVYDDGDDNYGEGRRYADSDIRNQGRRSGRDEDRLRKSAHGRSSRDGRSSSDREEHRRSSDGRRGNRDDRRNTGRSGRSTSRNDRRSGGSKERQSFTVYDLLRILLPVLVIVLLIVIIRSFMAARTPEETTVETTTVIETTVQETETEPETTEPETTEPETTAAVEYRIVSDGVNIRYADNQNRIYTQLSKGTAIGTVTPIDGSDYVAFTLDGVNVVVRKDMIEAIS